jgi:hypothetical protein
VHPLKSPSLFSQSKNLTTSTLLHNIKQNQNKPVDYNNSQIHNAYENEIYRNNYILSQMNGFKGNPYFTQQYYFQNDTIKNFKSKNNFKIGNNLFTKNKPKTIKSDQNLSLMKPGEIKSDINYTILEQTNNVLLNIKIKTDNGIKIIELKRRDNISSIVEKFCKENKLNADLISPIHHYINKAMSSIDEVLYKNNVNENIVNKIKNVYEKFSESSDSTNCDDVNLSCISVNDYERDNIEDILNKTL